MRQVNCGEQREYERASKCIKKTQDRTKTRNEEEGGREQKHERKKRDKRHRQTTRKAANRDEAAQCKQ